MKAVSRQHNTSRKIKILHPSRLIFLLLVFSGTGLVQAQDLEPRRWSHLPSGLNIIAVGYGYTSGDILLDPVLLAEDVTFDLHVMGLSYIRSFSLFGKSARIDVVAPYASGRWQGLVDGNPVTLQRRGMMDSRFRVSINLYGAPALKGKEFIQYRRGKPTNTIIGASLQLVAPTGEYTSERLINLGNNRWVFRPQLGILHQRNQLQLELTGSVFLYETNKAFWKGTVRKQNPLWFLQSHLIYTFKPGLWASLSAGFAYGGRSTINAEPKADSRRTSFLAASVGMNIGQRQSVRITLLRRATNASTGINLDSLLVGWSYHWSN